MTEEQDKSAHRKIIRIIDLVWSNGHPFSPREISLAAGVSRSSVTRVLLFLVEYKFVNHSEKAFRGRHYTVSQEKWDGDVDAIIRNFEFSRFLAS